MSLDALNQELARLRSITAELKAMQAQCELLSARALASMVEIHRLAQETQAGMDTEMLIERVKGMV